MKFKRRNAAALVIWSAGTLAPDNPEVGETPKHFPYRSSSNITEFFAELDTDWEHDGSTRRWWVADVIEAILDEPHDGWDIRPDLLPPHRPTHGPARCPSTRGAERPYALEQLQSKGAHQGRIRSVLRRGPPLLPAPSR